MGAGDWQDAGQGWWGREAELRLQGWTTSRGRPIEIVRRGAAAGAARRQHRREGRDRTGADACLDRPAPRDHAARQGSRAERAARHPHRPAGRAAARASRAGCWCKSARRSSATSHPASTRWTTRSRRLEDAVIGSASKELRRSLADIRRRAVHLRRYLGPEREALIRLQTEDTRLLDKQDRLRLRCVIDSVIRYLEDMDALRDRTTILHEDLAAQISEKIAQTSNRLTAVAALLLPPSLVAGMLGMPTSAASPARTAHSPSGR